MTQFIDCLIIGGGQAGLAMSHSLGSIGIDHVVLERGTVAHRWTSARWPTLRLLTPGWMTRMPGRQLAQARDGFLDAGDLAARLRTYADEAALPVIENVDVLALERLGSRFRAVTSRGTWIARSVVIATGACDRARVPDWGHELSPAIHQMTSMEYRGIDALPDGGVLVVGGSATGIQLADEIVTSGRKTMLATGSHVRTPRSYRGRDIFEWLDDCGFLGEARPTGRDYASLAGQPSMQLVGRDANDDIDLYTLATKGVEIAGHADGGQGNAVVFADDLIPMLAKAEKRRANLLARIDGHIDLCRLNAPLDRAAHAPALLMLPMTGAINLRAHGISTVLWATGYRRDYSWIHFDACDRAGELRQAGGICDIPGLYTMGLPFMRHRASSFIDGVGRDAAELAPIIAAELGATSNEFAACAA